LTAPTSSSGLVAWSAGPGAGGGEASGGGGASSSPAWDPVRAISPGASTDASDTSPVQVGPRQRRPPRHLDHAWVAEAVDRGEYHVQAVSSTVARLRSKMESLFGKYEAMREGVRSLMAGASLTGTGSPGAGAGTGTGVTGPLGLKRE
jgi:hypothetical protein